MIEPGTGNPDEGQSRFKKKMSKKFSSGFFFRWVFIYKEYITQGYHER